MYIVLTKVQSKTIIVVVSRPGKKGGKVKNTNSGGNGKAEKLSMTQLIVLSAYRKTYSTGKKGFHGKVLDPATGKRYQVVTAVEIQ